MFFRLRVVFLRAYNLREPLQDDWVCIYPDGSRGLIPFGVDLHTAPLPNGVDADYCFVVSFTEL